MESSVNATPKGGRIVKIRPQMRMGAINSDSSGFAMEQTSIKSRRFPYGDVHPMVPSAHPTLPPKGISSGSAIVALNVTNRQTDHSTSSVTMAAIAS